MRLTVTLEHILFARRKSGMKKTFRQTIMTMLTFFLCFSPGMGMEQPPQCHPEDFAFCPSPCTYVRTKCEGDPECSIDLCSYLYPICHPRMNCPRFLHTCWDLFSECSLHDTKNINTKRSILNKSVAYLLLKLHPYLNQTSQFGTLSSGRIRRITGNFGTEFLGKRSNPTRSRQSSGKPQSRPTPSTKFFSLPLNKFAQTKVLKRDYSFLFEDPRERRGNGKIILGSEFLGKRDSEMKGRKWDEKIRKLLSGDLSEKRATFDGSELLGKRSGSVVLDGSEFLGKRTTEDTLGGSELLGKKSNKDFVEKRFGNELLGKRYTGNELLGKKDRGISKEEIWTEDDPELLDEAFYNYRSFPNIAGKGRGCSKSSSDCSQSRSKEFAMETGAESD